MKWRRAFRAARVSFFVRIHKNRAHALCSRLSWLTNGFSQNTSNIEFERNFLFRKHTKASIAQSRNNSHIQSQLIFLPVTFFDSGDFCWRYAASRNTVCLRQVSKGLRKSLRANSMFNKLVKTVETDDPALVAELIAFLSGNHYDLIFLQKKHLSSTKKFQIPGYYTLRTDRTFGRQGPVSSATHNTGGGVFTLIHSDLAFSPVSVSCLSFQDPYSDYTCVTVLLSNHSPLQLLNLYSPSIRNTPSDSRTRTFYPDILPNSPDTFILEDFNAHDPTWDRLIPPNPLGNDLFRWITSSGLEILNDPASPTLLHHSTGRRSSPDISLAPASLAPRCEWRTLPGLGSDHLPIEIVLSLSPVRHPNTRPPKFNYKKTSWDVYQSYIAEHLPSLDFDALNIHQAAHSFSLFLVEAAKASIPFGRLGRSPKAWWSQEAESAVRERRRARSVAHRSESHRLRYIDASRRASSVISRAKSATWQATCSNLSPCSDPRAVFRLLNAISGKKNTSQDPFFLNCTSPLDTANHYASYLRSHLSQATPRSSRRAERQFMNELRKASCEDASSLHNSFCSPFSLTELSTAISNLSSSTASGPDQIA